MGQVGTSPSSAVSATPTSHRSARFQLPYTRDRHPLFMGIDVTETGDRPASCLMEPAVAPPRARSQSRAVAHPCRVAPESVRGWSYPPVMVLGIVIFGLVFLAGLTLGTIIRRPLTTACIVVGAFAALLVLQAHEPFVAFAAFALIGLAGIVVDSVRETVGLLLGR